MFLSKNLNSTRESYESFVRSGCLSDVRGIKVLISRKSQDLLTRNLIDTYVSQAQFYLEQRQIAHLFNSKMLTDLSQSFFRKKSCRVVIPRSWLGAFNESMSIDLPIKTHKFKYLRFRLKLIVRSLYRVLRMLTYSLFRTFLRNEIVLSDVYVVGHSNLNVQDSTLKKRDFSYWLSLRLNRELKVEFLFETEIASRLIVQSQYRSTFSMLVFTLRRMLSLHKAGISFSDVFSMIDQIMLSHIVDCIESPSQTFYFTESSGGIRPLWTYTLELKGAQVGLVNFSNASVLSLDDRFSEIDPTIVVYNWGNYFCCTIRQFDQIRRFALPDQSFNLLGTGVPWLSESFEEIFDYTNEYIAVFDFETYDNHFGITTLNELGYGHLEMNEEFLLPIVKAAKMVGLRVVHKPKRNQKSKISNSKAGHLRAKLEEYDNYTRIDARFSAHAVIAGAKGVVSMPPTTTALIARELMLPSVYFDSVGKILPEDPALDEIEILNSETEIEKWLRTL